MKTLWLLVSVLLLVSPAIRAEEEEKEKKEEKDKKYGTIIGIDLGKLQFNICNQQIFKIL